MLYTFDVHAQTHSHPSCLVHLAPLSVPPSLSCHTNTKHPLPTLPQNLERLFVSHQELWTSAIEAVGVLDCLMALAGAALAADGTMCRPVLLAPPSTTTPPPAHNDAAGSKGTDIGSSVSTPAAAAVSGGVFRARQLRHPAGIAGAGCGSFVPNDIELGGDSASFILLTGPNM